MPFERNDKDGINKKTSKVGGFLQNKALAKNVPFSKF